MKINVKKIVKAITVGIFCGNPFLILDNTAKAGTDSSNLGVSYVQFDYCSAYYPDCTKRVIKCRPAGSRFCEAAIQLPCEEACTGGGC